jgi:hypothetical protein
VLGRGFVIRSVLFGQVPGKCVEHTDWWADGLKSKYPKEYQAALIREKYGQPDEEDMTKEQLRRIAINSKRAERWLDKYMATWDERWNNRPKEAPYHNHWKKEFAWKRSK